MAKIGVIAPNDQVREQSVLAARQLGMAEDVVVHIGNVWDGIDLAKQMAADGIEVVVARGSTADFLIRSDIHITVVPITLTCRDLRQVVLDSQKITGLANPRIAVMSVRVMNEDVELYAQALGVNLDVYPIIGTPESIEDALDEVGSKGADLVVGGLMTMRMAQEDGFRTMPLPTSVESMKLFLGEAAKVVRAVAVEQARTRRFETLVGHLREGVLYVEPTGRIRIANPAAELMLGRDARELSAMRIDNLLPIPGLADCLFGVVESVEEIVTVGDATLLVTIIPAHVGRDPSGVIVSLQETNRIAQMDSRIRKSTGARGLVAPRRFEDIWGGSAAIREAKRLAAEYAAVDSTILIFGETGTGKELFAQSIHNASRYAGGPFVAVNCAALPPALLESELFGYDEGAFTGANRKGKAGLIELAHGGTLFLDEVSEMDRHGQVRLLRFLQERQIMRLGGDKYLPVETRVVAATNRDLGAMVADREFREDLYYRLKVLTLNVPPLRDRQGDILHLIERMRTARETEFGHKIRFAPEVVPLLKNHPWPGNVRELANVMENLAVAGRRRLISGAMVKNVLMRSHGPSSPAASSVAPSPCAAHGEEGEVNGADQSPDERRRLVAALAAAGGNQSRAARALGMHRSTLHRKMLAHRIRFRAG